MEKKAYYIIEQTKHPDQPVMSGYWTDSEEGARKQFCFDTGYQYEDTRVKHVSTINPDQYRRNNCTACAMLKHGVRFRRTPPHTCGK